MLETSAEDMVDGEKDKRTGYRKHQTRMDTGVDADFGHVVRAGGMEIGVMFGRAS